MRRASAAVVLFSVLVFGQPAWAQEHEPLVWPTIRYGWPERLSAGAAFQPPFDGMWDLLVGTLTIGQGGFKAGVGLGKFGGSLMGGYGIQATVLRTSDTPQGAPPRATFVGIEGHLMAFNLGVRIGPAVRVGVSGSSESRLRFNLSVGLGF